MASDAQQSTTVFPTMVTVERTQHALSLALAHTIAHVKTAGSRPTTTEDLAQSALHLCGLVLTATFLFAAQFARIQALASWRPVLAPTCALARPHGLGQLAALQCARLPVSMVEHAPIRMSVLVLQAGPTRLAQHQSARTLA